jgi:glycosyltransferase involved in cell wall biosynthesis
VIVPSPYPPEIAQLEAAMRAVGALSGAEEASPYLPHFHAALAVLTQEADLERRRRYLHFLEQFVPDAGLGRAFALSFLVAASGEVAYLRALRATVWQPGFTLEQRHFFYWQLLTRHSSIRGAPELEPAAVYSSLLKSYREALNVRPHWIGPADRNPDAIIVITNQLLGPAHAPTADCLDYCHVLQSRLKKKVLLINTADMPWTLQLPYYDPIRFNYAKEYAAIGELRFKGEAFEFYQCRKPMPNLEEIRAIVTTVRTRTPAFVLSLGHSNVAPDLCAPFVTVATMPFGTDLPRAKSNLFILPRKRRPDDADFMREWGVAEDQIIESEYTFALPERTASLTRTGLGLPENAYVIAVVGNRLDEEITTAVVADLLALLRAVPQAFLAFMGTFPRFARLTQEHPTLAARSVFLGHQKDVPAVYERCNAYLNPPRYGGGTSAAFALATGLPALTGNTGDVANIAGARFVFDSFRAITAFVERSVSDPDHRREWAAAATARYAEISDREGMLRGIIEGVTAKADRRTAPAVDEA